VRYASHETEKHRHAHRNTPQTSKGQIKYFRFQMTQNLCIQEHSISPQHWWGLKACRKTANSLPPRRHPIERTNKHSIMKSKTTAITKQTDHRRSCDDKIAMRLLQLMPPYIFNTIVTRISTSVASLPTYLPPF